MADPTSKNHNKVVLVVGACCLDRLLSVATFPIADSKIRTTAHHEVGGGGAANTAVAMGRLCRSSFLRENNAGFTIKLLTKMGGDTIGHQLQQDLKDNGVDTSQVHRGGPGTTTGLCTIIVSQEEAPAEPTRTCLWTPGTCGDLSLQDLGSLEELFENVIHLHSDGRHIDVALALAKEARRRGISVTVDAEKDRNSTKQDALLELSTCLFTNAGQLEDYFKRRTMDLEEEHGTQQKMTTLKELPNEKDCTIEKGTRNFKIKSIFGKSIRPSSFYLLWYGASQLQKSVVITKGQLGALHIQPIQLLETIKEDDSSFVQSVTPIHFENGTLQTTFVIEQIQQASTSSDGSKRRKTKSQFKVKTTGVLKDLTMVDTTGAGDAFIGGYLVWRLRYTEDDDALALQFGAWVAGQKLQGPGAQTALPTAAQVDEQLGRTKEEVECSLHKLIGAFGDNI